MSDLFDMLMRPLVLDAVLHEGTTEAAAWDFVERLDPLPVITVKGTVSYYKEPRSPRMFKERPKGKKCDHCLRVYGVRVNESCAHFEERKYCSRACAGKAQSIARTGTGKRVPLPSTINMICRHCRAPFVANRGGGMRPGYCKQECRRAARNERRNPRKAPITRVVELEDGAELVLA